MATTLYYSLPDVLTSRAARGWARAGLTAVAVAVSLPEIRTEWASARQELGGRPAEAFASLPAGGKRVALGAGAAVLAVTAGVVVAVERAVFRRGQARVAAGRRLPHTRPALLYGALAGGFWLINPPRRQQPRANF